MISEGGELSRFENLLHIILLPGSDTTFTSMATALSWWFYSEEAVNIYIFALLLIILQLNLCLVECTSVETELSDLACLP